VSSGRILHKAGRIGGFHADLADQGFNASARLLHYGWVSIPEELCRRFQLPQQEILSAQKLIFASDEPIVIGSALHRLPEGVNLSPEEVHSDSVFQILTDKYGLNWNKAERVMEASLPTSKEAKLLEITRTTPVLRIELTVFDNSDEWRSLVCAVYRGDRYRYLQRIEL
jgi:GntR family transcriptional regulator